MLTLFAVALFVAWLLARYFPITRTAGVFVARSLEAPRGAPLAIFALTTILVTVAWGSWRQPPVVHDEASYLLQARIFASGHWTAAAPPVPEFFEQFYVFVVPHYASKYPPGHALLMVPGIWLGFPGMMPVFLAATAGALIFSLARRLANGVVAFWTWMSWITTPIVLWGLGSYFSESTSTCIWVLGWYALLRWRDGRERWLLLVAFCVAWLTLTRLLTGVAYAIPIAVYVLWRVSRTKQYGALGRAMVLGCATLLLIPLWNLETIGTIRHTPWAVYSRTYFPWDSPGYGLNSSRPTRALPPDMQRMALQYRGPHVAFVPATLPRAFAERAINVAKSLWRPPRVAFFLFALVGLAAMTTEIAFGLASMLTLMVAYLWFYHDPNWVIYYLEPGSTLAFLSAVGFWRVMHWLTRDMDGDAAEPRTTPAVAGASLLLMIAAVGFTAMIVSSVRQRNVALQSYQRNFLAKIASIPADKAIVFLHYRPDHNPNSSLLYNDPNLATAKRWIVYDRGADNARLLRTAPDRRAFIYDEASNSVYPMTSSPLPGHVH